MKTKLLTSLSHSAMIKTALVTSFTASLIACIDLGSETNTQFEEKAGIQLKEDANKDEFKRYLTASFTQQAADNRNTIYADELNFTEGPTDGVTTEADSTVSESGNEAEFSNTNTQVSGVDEGDIWKYDGENFFVLQPAQWQFQYDDSNNTIDGCAYAEPMPATELLVDDSSSTSSSSTSSSSTISILSSPVQNDLIMPCNGRQVMVSPAQIRIVKNSQETLSNLELGEIDPSELYLNTNSLVVLGNRNAYQNNWSSYQNWQDGQTNIQIINVEDKTQPEVNFSVSMDGYVVQSRRIGDEVFIVSRYSPTIQGLDHYPESKAEVLANQQIIDNLKLSDLLPKITINDQSFDLIPDHTCLIPEVSNPQMGTSSLTVMTRININDAQFTSRCMAGDVQGIYMSQSKLYTFNTSYWNFSETSLALDWNAGNTHLHNFDLTSFDYQGSALVEGVLAGSNPRLRLGELKDGSIAMVTSKKATTADWRLTQHQLTVLNQQEDGLEVISSLPNEEQPAAIGKVNEQIYSVRFMQDRAYIVTFQKVDPLYVIDLSDPLKPTIAGELEIPGFSDYLHPIGKDLLLGIGKDAKLGQSGTTWYQGVKVSLFNVADIRNPTELGNILIGKRGSSTPLSYNPLSFTGIQQDGQYRFAFPIMVNDGPAQGNYWGDPESQFYKWSQSGLYLFEVKDNQLTQAGALITKSSESNDENSYHSMNSSRGLIQGNDVYHLSGSDLYKADWDHPEQVSEKF